MYVKNSYLGEIMSIYKDPKQQSYEDSISEEEKRIQRSILDMINIDLRDYGEDSTKDMWESKTQKELTHNSNNGVLNYIQKLEDNRKIKDIK